MATTIYASLAELKLYMGEMTTSANDSLLNICLDGASRAIDSFTRRRFWIDDAVSTRVYRSADVLCRLDEGDLLLTDDIAATLGVVVETWDSTVYSTVTASTYELYPESAIGLGKPATGVLLPSARWAAHRKLRVTAKWGWPAVPGEVRQACLIQASRLYIRKDSPQGVMGDAQWGLIRVPYMDPDVKSMLQPLQKILVT